MILGGFNGLDGFLDGADTPVVEFATGKLPALDLGVQAGNQLPQRRDLRLGGGSVAGDHLHDLTRAVFAAVPALGFRQTDGANHPDTLVTLNNLAAAYWESKQLDKSVPLFEELLIHSEKEFGRNHVNTKRKMANLGINYRDAGRLTEALPLLEEAYQSSHRQPLLRFVGPALLDAYVRARKRDEAAKLAAELLADNRRDLPADSPQLAGALAFFGLSLLTCEAFAEAESMLRESLAIREKTQPDEWSTFNSRSLLGGSLLGQKKYSDAESLLLAGYEGMKQCEAAIPEQGKTRLPEAVDRLIELYTATDKPEEVQKWRAERAKYSPAATAETDNK